MSRDDTESTVESNDEFVRLSVKSKRGTGTRDQDVVKGTIQRETLEEVEFHREDLTALVEKQMADARAIQPDADDDVADDE